MAASSSTGHGNSSRSSHSDAAGRTTSSANVCTHFLSSTWSGPRSKLGVVGWSFDWAESAHAARLPTSHPAVTSNVQLPTFAPSTYHATRCLPVFAVAIVTNLFTPLGAGWALAHSRFFLPGNFTQTL